MSTRLNLQDVSGIDLAPQMIVRISPQEMTRTLGVPFEREADDLDGYSAAFFRARGQVFAFMRYDGEPEDNLTLYLERRLSPEEVGRALATIAKEFDIAAERIVWRETADLRPAATPA
jgi:hypothetical protein